MDWIPALLKHLNLSRSIVGAICITSTTVYVGHQIAPGYVEPLPTEWSLVVFGVTVFSTSLLLFWLCQATWAAARLRWKKTRELLASYKLSPLEIDAIRSMGEAPLEPLNLEHIDYERLSLSRLEVLELMRGLAKKGLVAFNQFDSRLISLTAKGRQRALEIERAANATLT